MRKRLDILNVEILNEKDMQIVKELQSHIGVYNFEQICQVCVTLRGAVHVILIVARLTFYQNPLDGIQL